MDRIVELFLATTDEGGSEEVLGELLAFHAAPLIRGIVSRRLGLSSSDADDLVSQVMLQLMVRLRQGRADGSLDAIDGFASYVANAAYHACDHYLRRRNPARWRLRNRLRYVLEHDRLFTIWKTVEGMWLCGLAEWRSRTQTGSRPQDGSIVIGPKQSGRDLLLHIFSLSNGPLELSTLVDLAGTAWRVPLYEAGDSRELEQVRDPRPTVDAEIEQSRKAKQAWEHISELPLRQRQALLLNLKSDAMSLFVITGTASLRRIAESLEMSAETFATLWNELPLPDNEIAARLGCTRQQVINLRMAARKRLANRMAGWS